MVKLCANPDLCVLLIAAISAFGVLIWTLEYLYNGEMFRNQRLYSWAILKTRWSFAARKNLLSACLDGLLSFPNVLYLLGFRAVAALLLVVFPWLEWNRLIGVGVIYISNVLLMKIRAATRRGSNTATHLIFGALFLEAIGMGTPIVTEACIWFIALQMCLLYCRCGVEKLKAPMWRDGTAMFEVANHRLYGWRPIAHYFYTRPRLVKTITWSVVLMESLFPLVLIMGYPACWFFLGWGVIFHLLNVVIIGLNSFFWSYLATYPAIIYCVLRCQAVLFG
jgi:hypothetical protein